MSEREFIWIRTFLILRHSTDGTIYFPSENNVVARVPLMFLMRNIQIYSVTAAETNNRNADSFLFLRYKIIFDVWIKRQTKKASPRRQTKASEAKKLIDEQQRRRWRRNSIRFQSEWKAKKSWQVFGFCCRPFTSLSVQFSLATAQQPTSNVILWWGSRIPLFDFFYQLSYLFLPANCLNKQTFVITCTASTSTTSESKNYNNNGGRTTDTTSSRVQCAANSATLALTLLWAMKLFVLLRYD